MKEYNLEKYLKEIGIWNIAQELGVIELCQQPDVKDIINEQYGEFKTFKERSYKTYTALDKEIIDDYVDTISLDVFTGFVICKALKMRSARDALDIKAAAEASCSQWITFFILNLQEMNLDAQGAYTVF